MKSSATIVLTLLVVLQATVLGLAADSESFASLVAPFLENYCYRCHAADEQSGERRFDQLDGTIHDSNSLAELQDMLDQLNLGEMPPSDEKQPDESEKRRVIEWLTQRIAAYHASNRSSGGQTTLRRLNAREYRNVVRDLLHLDMTMFDPTVEFPRDQTSEHLDNVGASLVTSGHLLAKYLTAAEQVVDKALFPREKPEVQTWEFHDGFRQQPEIDQVHGKSNGFTYLTLYDVVGADKHEGGYAPIHAFAEGVPHDGFYEIRFDATALNRLHPFDDDFLGTDRTELLRLGIVAGRADAGPLHKPQPMEPLLAEFELQDGQQEISVRLWLDRGITPRFTFRNGLFDARNLWNRTLKRYPDQFPKPSRSGIVEARRLAIVHGKFPQIHVDNITIEGPFYDDWPRASQRALLGEDCQKVLETGEMTDAQVRTGLQAFASRAYRRPIDDTDVQRLMQVVETRRAAGRTSLQAFADAAKTVLCSPSFLYCDETATERGNSLNAYALATRLALWLWSSMPDEELLAQAQSGQLLNPTVLEQQVERMLNDEKSNAFVHDFLDSWLTLRELGASPPDRGDFSAYYHYDLGTAMRQETQLFTRAILDENLPVRNFLDADFTFVNRPLARHYGLPLPSGSGFERVAINDPRRGGLLGQASVLTVTANGIDTSPVVRGVWLLENILGTPPSPPPPDVEPLDPDVRGATTIRDQLAKHRTNASCNDCHRKIDPPGFALENFDAIGGWRERYSKEAAIDPSGELPNGKSFDNIVGLKRILAEQEELFARALADKLLAYAIGRHTEPSDRPHVDQILAASENSDYGLRDLVRQVALSETFRSE